MTPAPFGLYTPWLLYKLSPSFLKNYEIHYDQRCKHYFFQRSNRGHLVDLFIVIRTSKHCHRIVYYNKKYEYFKYYVTHNVTETANTLNLTYKVAVDL